MVGRLIKDTIGKKTYYKVENIKTGKIKDITLEELQDKVKHGKVMLTNARMDCLGRFRNIKIHLNTLDIIQIIFNDLPSKKIDNKQAYSLLARVFKLLKINFKPCNIDCDKDYAYFILNNEIIVIHFNNITITGKHGTIGMKSSTKDICTFLVDLKGYNSIEQEISLGDIINSDINIITEKQFNCGDITVKLKNKPGVYQIKTPKTKGEFIKVKTSKKNGLIKKQDSIKESQGIISTCF